MNGSVLLDTNIIIALFANDVAVTQSLSSAPQVFVPSIVLGELHYGALYSGNPRKNTERVLEFAQNITVLNCDDRTAQVYASIKHALRRKGSPIPENDIWIAAIAVQYTLALATRDAHFDVVDGVSLLKW
jgi:tRNA(fMet)-specific endonuclease VapC